MSPSKVARRQSGLYVPRAGGGGGGGTYLANVLADAPLGYWRLGEASGTTMADSSGNGHGGTYAGGTLGQASTLLGDSNTAWLAPGAGSAYNVMASVPGAAWMTSPNITVEAMVRGATTLGGTIVGRDSSASRVWKLAMTAAGIPYFVSLGGSTVGAVGVRSVTDGNPHHVALSYDGTTMKLYIDGVLDTTSTLSQALPTAVVDLTIGNSNRTAGAEPMGATIDEVALYGTILSASRIAAHATAALGPYATAVLSDLPLAYWRLGEASGTTMADASGNAHPGTYIGSPTLGVAGLVTGDANTAATFAAANKYGDVAAASWISAPTAFTVEVLLKLATTSNQVFFANEDLSGSGKWGFQLASSMVYWGVNSSAGAWQYTNWATPLVVGTKYHIVGTYSGGVATLYVNGSSVASTSGLTAYVGTVRKIGIGGDAFASAPAQSIGCTGVVDEAAYYGTALSAARIAAHYAAA